MVEDETFKWTLNLLAVHVEVFGVGMFLVVCWLGFGVFF